MILKRLTKIDIYKQNDKQENSQAGRQIHGDKFTTHLNRDSGSWCEWRPAAVTGDDLRKEKAQKFYDFKF